MSALPRPTTSPPAVSIENPTVSYRQHPAVHHLSCQFAAGSLTAIVGPNGAGKSSLLDALVGKVRPSTGQVRLGQPGRARIAYLPQQSGIDRSFPLRVSDVVMLGAWSSLGLFDGASSAVHQRAQQALSEVGLAGFGQRLVGELSVGQFQRVLFARVLMQDAPLILLDEPFNAIDARTTGELLALVHRWHGEGRTVVAVLHDLDQVRRHFPSTLLLAREGLAHGPTPQVLSASNLQHARELAEQWDDAAAWCHRDAQAPAFDSGLPVAGHGHAPPRAPGIGHDPGHGNGHGHGQAQGHGHGLDHAHQHPHTDEPAHHPRHGAPDPGLLRPSR
jgi:zinc/manganese transport system ATP-binding protein